MDESIALLGCVIDYASIAQQFAAHGDARGFLYSLGKTVEHAIRAGDEGVALREISNEMREASRCVDTTAEGSP